MLSGKTAGQNLARRMLFAVVCLWAASCGAEARADCLSGKQTVNGNWYEYEMQNNCGARIKFNVDYCYPQDYSNENSAPDCEVRIVAIEGNGMMTFRNYGRPLNPRNLR